MVCTSDNLKFGMYEFSNIEEAATTRWAVERGRREKRTWTTDDGRDECRMPNEWMGGRMNEWMTDDSDAMYRYVNGLEKRANAAKIKRKRQAKKEERTIITNTSRLDIYLAASCIGFYDNEENSGISGQN